MPFYEYITTEADNDCDYCSRPVTILQKVDDPPMRQCPYCGYTVRRLISPPSLGSANSRTPSTSEVEKAGFTQYRKIGKGVYEKSAGKGPDIIDSD